MQCGYICKARSEEAGICLVIWILIWKKRDIPTHALSPPGQNPHLPEAEGVELRFLHNHSWFLLGWNFKAVYNFTHSV